MKTIIICALFLFFAVQEGVNGKPFFGSIVDTIHNVGCKVHDSGKCHPESNETERKQPQSLLGSLTQKIHDTAHRINCAIKTHEGCVEPTATTERSNQQVDISQLIDLRIEEDGDVSTAFSTSDGDQVTKRIITAPHNCPSGFRLDRRSQCRRIE